MTQAKHQSWAETPVTHRRRVLASLRDEVREHATMRRIAFSRDIAEAERHHARLEAAYAAALRVLDGAPKPQRRAKR